MRSRMLATSTGDGDRLLALDCASLGRLVRRRTLEAVALHFGMLAASSDRRACGVDRATGLIEESDE